jgi:transcriptional regulator with XRE-family HTH domain
MDNRSEVREFLMSRRAKVSPQDVGLPAGGPRRVPGLRRSEAAMLAGVSVEYYAKLERGAIAGASASVLDALAAALRLDETERIHLLDLARAADGIPTSGRRRRPAPSSAPSALRPALQWVLDSQTEGVAFVRDQHQNLLGINALGRAFYSPVIGEGGRVPNLARFQFLDPAAKDFYPDWERFAEMCVGSMRVEAGRDPHDTVLQDLVGELSTCSEAFRRLWGAHDVRTHGSGTKHFRHPVVGELTLAYEELAITAEPGRAVIVYTAQPGSTSAERLRLLASWAASQRLEGEVSGGGRGGP